MGLNLKILDDACTSCIRKYAGKHRLGKGDAFSIKCNGIPKDYISPAATASLTQDAVQSATALLDPVTWAKELLDWHCLDPDGEIWKRKDPLEHAQQMEEYPERKSKYHRPYQAEMLRCTARRKAFRIGRQAGKTETLIISIVFNLFVNEGFKIVLITPFQSQIELIFSRVKELIATNPQLQNSIKRSVSAPQHTLELHNGSYIKGFTAGTRSGGNADSVRGQTANMLVFDEADYLAPGDMDSALAIITNFPNATVWMSSTPTGKRERFYEACSDTYYKEFHYPSQVNPNWNEEKEQTFRRQLTSIGYQHEILADFGAQAEGVFQVGFVEAAQTQYNYADMRPDHRWQYTVGVDWNEPKVGTTMVVTGFNPTANKFFVVERRVIQRDKWTQLDACQAIAELNRKWRPFAVYVDKGFGGTQFEVLRKYGFDARIDPERGPNHLDAKLTSVVKQYDFGSVIEIRDPFTKQPSKKPAKGFLVESAVRRFEANDLCYPADDKQLTKELLGYIVDRVSIHGQFVYGTNSDSVGDHNLDALMLSLVAFTIEKTAFGRPQLIEKIVFQPGLTHPTSGHDHSDEKRSTWKELRKLARPGSGRDDMEKSPGGSASDKVSMPAANTKEADSSKLWVWPGWEADKPAPDVSQQRQKFELLKKGPQNASSRGSQLGRPKRRNID